MSAAEETPAGATPDLGKLADVVDAVLVSVRDKQQQVRLALAAMLSGGHVLIEDAPGMGKTSLARALGHHLQLDWSRLQCTNDTTPSDIVGVNIFDPKSGDFEFRRGPVFTQLLLADELNRAPSKSQSALLEAMAERQVTVDGTSFSLPEPFIVIATQNPDRADRRVAAAGIAARPVCRLVQPRPAGRRRGSGDFARCAGRGGKL